MATQIENPVQINVFEDAQALGAAFLKEFVRLAGAAIAARGQFAVALTGGRTARDVYARVGELSANPKPGEVIDWTRVKVFWGDERTVPPEDPASNYKLAHDAWLSKSPIPRKNVFRWQTEALDKSAEAARYAEAILGEVPANPAARGGLPAFDLVMLGMGDDGHVASLLPGTPAVEFHTELTAWNPVPQLGARRFTFTFPLINAAREVWLLVTGGAKSALVERVVALQRRAADEAELDEMEIGPSQWGRAVLPAARVRPTEGTIRWWLDQAAGAALSSR